MAWWGDGVGIGSIAIVAPLARGAPGSGVSR